MSTKDIFDEDDNQPEDYDESKNKYDFIPHGFVKKKANERQNLKLRACISCRLIMTEDQFYDNGCGNCNFLQMDGDRRRVLDCTSSNFFGFISVMEPSKSWSAKYNNLNDLIPGCYAISVNGVLPDSIKDEIIE